MIPKDVKARCEAAITNAQQQTQAEDHFYCINPEDKPTPYTDEILKEGAIQWLVETD